jgi:lysophospholipase L1-like esterase
MPVISRGVPASTNSNCGGSYPASNANDTDYATVWNTCTAPSAASPEWLAYDLSGVPTAHRGQVVLSWYNDLMTGDYDHTVVGDTAYNNVGAYTIDANTAPGGTVPTSGWTTLVTVAGNKKSSMQHVLNLAGYNWVRLNATASDGSSGNNGIAIDMDVQDASAGVADDWIFYGDSITQDGLSHDDRSAVGGGTVGTLAQAVNADNPGYFPLYQDGGIGGLTSASGASLVPGWLNLFPGRYVVLAYGTNDANNASSGDASIVQPYYNNMATMIQAVIAAGKVPVLPTIPYGKTASLKANVPTLNAQIPKLLAAFPQAVAGPDLYSFFQANSGLISSDNIHPSWDNGYAAYRQQWAAWITLHFDT